MGKNVTQKLDKLLWADFISGNEAAFKEIYSVHSQPLFKYGCHFTNDENLVLDCIQDLFVDLHRYRAKLGKADNIRIYLFISLKRKIFRRLDQEKKLKTLSLDGLPFQYSLISDDPGDEEIMKARIEQLEKAMKELSSRQREAIYLRFVKGMSYEELGEVMQMNYQSARNLIFRGIEKLRKCCQNNPVFLLFYLLKEKTFKKCIR
jgi:RNA polymerase sigma factor (sigma-70 family)